MGVPGRDCSRRSVGRSDTAGEFCPASGGIGDAAFVLPPDPDGLEEAADLGTGRDAELDRVAPGQGEDGAGGGLQAGAEGGPGGAVAASQPSAGDPGFGRGVGEGAAEVGFRPGRVG